MPVEHEPTRFAAPSGAPVRRGRLALFDLDRTLISGSSLTTLAWVAVRHGLIGPRSLLAVARHNLRFAAVGEQGNIADIARTGVLQAIAGRSTAEFEPVVEQATRRLDRRVRPGMRRALELHRGIGDRCVIVSASPHEIVVRLAYVLGADAGVGTKGALIDGVYTGDLDGPFCHGDGKILRLVEELGPVDLRRAVCYADSASDLPLLEATGVPIAVSPDRRLREIAIERGWSLHE